MKNTFKTYYLKKGLDTHVSLYFHTKGIGYSYTIPIKHIYNTLKFEVLTSQNLQKPKEGTPYIEANFDVTSPHVLFHILGFYSKQEH